MLRTYKLMYFFGVWITSATIAAESDAEAIFDADSEPKKALDKCPYALFCGNRKVKEYFRQAK